MSEEHDPRDPPGDEPRAVIARYARREAARAAAAAVDRYSPMRPEIWQMLHERQRALLGLLALHRKSVLSTLSLTEVGCGSGGNLLELLRLGFAPEQLQGIELLPERHAQARHVLPAATRLWLGDACDTAIEAGSQDLVLQSTVFSSLLDDAFQARLAGTMWQWLKPGGAVLWYDFTIDNPFNRDVRGVPLSRLDALFPAAARRVHRRVTLAPPLARAVCRVHPALYTAFNALPLLRTHVLAWIEKSR